jgi:hypothetical protein
MEAAGFEIATAQAIGVWGLPVQIVLARKPPAPAS